MNNEERANFWNTLLKAKSLDDTERVFSTIRFPKYVYRYRAVNEYSLSALGENKLFFSTSNYYDDPFDTYIHIDFSKVKSMATALENGTVPERLFLGNDNLRLQAAKAKGTDLTGTTVSIINYLKETRNDIRKHTWSICFSENYDNENLWLKYANSHKGFVLEYDVEQLLKSAIDVEKKEDNSTCDNCKSNNLSSFIMPVYYAKDKYDATEYAGFCGVCKLLAFHGQNNLVQQLLTAGTCMWEALRIVLIKKWIHHYDEEWRLLLNSKNRVNPACKPFKICKPNRVILGLNLTETDCQNILLQVKQAGISSCNRMIINDEDEFVSDERNLLQV